MATKEELGREILAELEKIPDKEWEVSWFVSSFIVPRSLILVAQAHTGPLPGRSAKTYACCGLIES